MKAALSENHQLQDILEKAKRWRQISSWQAGGGVDFRPSVSCILTVSLM